MIILHTSDWHLGAQLHGYDRTDAQFAAIRNIINVAAQRKVDAVVVSGDVFDVSAPSSMAQNMLSQLLGEMRRACPDARIILTAGNHDGASRLQAFRQIFDIAGITVVGVPGRVDDPSNFADRLAVDIAGKGYVIALPYVNSRLLNDDFRKAVAEGVGRLDASRPVVLMAHQAVSGCVFRGHTQTDTIVGGLSVVAADILGGAADYVALGHIHKPQTLKGGHARYSGSPLQVSFDEDYPHSVSIVEIAGRGARPVIEEVQLDVAQPLVTIGGEDGISPDEAVERARREADPDTRSLPPGAYVRINLNIAPGQTLTSAQETEIRQAIDEAGCTYVLSNIRVARHEADGEGSAPLSVAEFRRLTPQDVAIDYCRRTGCSLTDEQMALFNEVVDLVREPGGDDDENDEK